MATSYKKTYVHCVFVHIFEFGSNFIGIAAARVNKVHYLFFQLSDSFVAFGPESRHLAVEVVLHPVVVLLSLLLQPRRLPLLVVKHLITLLANAPGRLGDLVRHRLQPGLQGPYLTVQTALLFVPRVLQDSDLSVFLHLVSAKGLLSTSRHYF